MATVKFLTGEKANITSGLENEIITEGSVLITEDTDELAVVDAEKNVNFIKSRTQQEHILIGTSIGAIAEGTALPIGMSFDEFLTMASEKAIPATYTKPTVAVSRTAGSNAGNYEVGTSITTSVKSVFTKNDAGDITSNTIYKNNDSAQLATGVSSTVTAENVAFVVPEGSINIYSKASYNAAPVKNNNLGHESTENWFNAGTVQSGNLTFTGQRKYFYGAGNGATPTITADVVRGLGGNALNPKAGTSFNVPVAVGQQHVIFAYPANLRDVNQVMYVETNDTGMASSFTKETISVGGADSTTGSTGSYATDYKVYHYAMAAPAAAAMTFKVTI